MVNSCGLFGELELWKLDINIKLEEVKPMVVVQTFQGNASFSNKDKTGFQQIVCIVKLAEIFKLNLIFVKVERQGLFCLLLLYFYTQGWGFPADRF